MFGLENNRYFCYLNACLQCLFAVDEFRSYYEKEHFHDVKIKKPVAEGMRLKFSLAMKDFAIGI